MWTSHLRVCTVSSEVKLCVRKCWHKNTNENTMFYCLRLFAAIQPLYISHRCTFVKANCESITGTVQQEALKLRNSLMNIETTNDLKIFLE